MGKKHHKKATCIETEKSRIAARYYAFLGWQLVHYDIAGGFRILEICIGRWRVTLREDEKELAALLHFSPFSLSTRSSLPF